MIPSTVGLEHVIWLSDSKNFQTCQMPKLRRKRSSQIIVVCKEMARLAKFLTSVGMETVIVLGLIFVQMCCHRLCQGW